MAVVRRERKKSHRWINDLEQSISAKGTGKVKKRMYPTQFVCIFRKVSCQTRQRESNGTQVEPRRINRQKPSQSSLRITHKKNIPSELHSSDTCNQNDTLRLISVCALINVHFLVPPLRQRSREVQQQSKLIPGISSTVPDQQNVGGSEGKGTVGSVKVHWRRVFRFEGGAFAARWGS